jgi:hypothetical protein
MVFAPAHLYLWSEFAGLVILQHYHYVNYLLFSSKHVYSGLVSLELFAIRQFLKCAMCAWMKLDLKYTVVELGQDHKLCPHKWTNSLWTKQNRWRTNGMVGCLHQWKGFFAKLISHCQALLLRRRSTTSKLTHLRRPKTVEQMNEIVGESYCMYFGECDRWPALPLHTEMRW